MKLTDKLNVLNESLLKRKMVTCYFTYDDSYVHYYVTNLTNKFVLGAEEYDFDIKGYEIRKLSRIKKVHLRNDKTDEINDKLGLTRTLEFYPVDLTSWESIFNYLYSLDNLVEIVCDNSETSYFGKIKEVTKNYILFHDFDADGIWQEPMTINFKDIDGVVWDSWYLNGWKFYFDESF